MAVWTTDDTLGEHVDFDIARRGFLLEADYGVPTESVVLQLEELGYLILHFDASRWSEKATMLAEFANALDFPDYFGMNLDALNDCLGEVAEHQYGWRGGDHAGLILHISGLSSFARVDPHSSKSAVEIIRNQAGYAALFGNRILGVLD